MTQKWPDGGGGTTAAYDPLDLHLERLRDSTGGGWPGLSSQTTLLLLTGIALGPRGLTLLTPAILDLLQPAVPVALAVLGAAAVSPESGSRRAARLAALIVVAGGVAPALQHGVAALLDVAQAAAIAVLLAGAGWVLCAHGAAEDERRVFSIATVLLVGGVADYRAVSGLLLGAVAASAWRLLQPADFDTIRRDVAYVQHPLTAVLLVTAGARVTFSTSIATIAAIAAAAIFIAARFGPARFSALRGFGGAAAPATFAIAVAIDAARLDNRLAALVSVGVLTAVASALLLRGGDETT